MNAPGHSPERADWTAQKRGFALANRGRSGIHCDGERWPEASTKTGTRNGTARNLACNAAKTLRMCVAGRDGCQDGLRVQALEAPTADELGPGIENGKGEGPGITPSHVSECGRPSDAELTFSLGRMPKEARNG